MSRLVTQDQRASWEQRGFFRIAGFAPPQTCDAMLARVTEVVRDPALAGQLGVKVLEEANLASQAVDQPEDGVSKVFKLHRDPVFAEFARTRPRWSTSCRS